MEHFDALSDDSLLHVEQLNEYVPVERTAWWEDFQHDLYDWNDPEFRRRNRGKEAYRPVLLTQGYFMMVLVRSYERMTKFSDGTPKKWYVQRKFDQETGELLGVYAYRKGNKKYGEPRDVAAHRELLGILHEPLLIGDHVNCRGLDNRGDEKSSVNLKRACKRISGHNRLRLRVVNLGLLMGVERHHKNRDGKQRYGGKVCIRLNKKKVVTIRSKMAWFNPERAHRWYLNYLERVHKRSQWAQNPKSVSMPFFPPRWDSEPVVSAKSQTTATPAEQSLADTF